MTVKQTLLTTVITALLVGCGSTSSEGSVDTSSSTGSTTSSSSISSSASRTESGYIIQDDSQEGEAVAAYVTEVSDDGNSDLNTITIKGTSITLVPEGVSSAGFYTESDEGTVVRVVSGTKYSSVKFGFAAKDDVSDIFGLFAHGFATDVDSMPSSGSATYVGDAVGGVEQTTDGVTTGSANIAVNFSDKSLSGTLSNWQDSTMKDISFTAVISGNTFSKTGDTAVSGQFYGDSAAEIGGVVNTRQDGNAAFAAFGAIKQ